MEGASAVLAAERGAHVRDCRAPVACVDHMFESYIINKGHSNHVNLIRAPLESRVLYMPQPQATTDQ